MTATRWRCGPALAAALALAGCSGGEERCHPVRGVVVYDDGRPATELAGGSVALLPDAPGKPSPSGSIGEDGTFVISTRADGDGAVPGKYTAVVEPPDPNNESDDSPKRKRAAPSISPDSREHPVTVEAKANDLRLTVRRPAEKGKK